jgi:hypothetical protein
MECQLANGVTLMCQVAGKTDRYSRDLSGSRKLEIRETDVRSARCIFLW